MPRPKKLTIIATKTDGWHQQELLKAAKKYGFEAVIENITSVDIPDKICSKLGDAVIWRSSSVDPDSERTSLIDYLKDKIVVSDSVFKLPAVRYKYFQQCYLKSHRIMSQWSIPTYRPHTHTELKKYIDSGRLTFPIIAKPNHGAHGTGILLLHNNQEVKTLAHLRDYVFQNFISNNGDWRIIVIGGNPLGAMQRIAPKGSFLNNISKGATAKLETDEATLKQLFKIATKVASLFHLAFCGVDIIRDTETGKLYILEVNTAPQWGSDFGFQSTTGVDVPEVLIQWIVERTNAGSGKITKDIEHYYKNRIDIHFLESFHFASRLWLWAGDSWARNLLDTYEQRYVGQTDAAVTATLKKILGPSSNGSIVNQEKLYRQTSFEKYPMLSKYVSVLFKTLFVQTLYGRDIRALVERQIPDESLIALFDELVKDKDATRLLSTHAINYFYLLKNYYRDDLRKTNVHGFNPVDLIALLPGYKELEDKKLVDCKTSIKLQIYLLTHAIIGQSGFYSIQVKEDIYKKLCREIETIIKNNFFEVSLDNKFEFLVCAALCGYESELRVLIEKEASQSVSWAGNFIVDKVNATAGNKTDHCLRTAEHRNVLYLMSQRPFKQSSKNTKSGKKPKITLKKTIGIFEKVKFPEFDGKGVIAKVDTGAYSGALHVTRIHQIREGDKKTLCFSPFGHPQTVYHTQNFRVGGVRSSDGVRTKRYFINTEIILRGETFPITLSLFDRTNMKWPVLIGRKFLRENKLVVDSLKSRK